MDHEHPEYSPIMEDAHDAELNPTPEPRVIKINIKTAVIIVAVIVLGILVYYCRGLVIAATVNGQPITRLAVIKELERVSGKNALEALITRKLIDNETAKQGITVSETDINAEIATIESQLKSQGQTLDAALKAQNITLDDFRSQVTTQKKLEKLLGDKIAVSDVEIESYITANKITIPAGQEATYKMQIKNQLVQQKLNSEAGALVNKLKANASIKYYVNY